MSTWRVALANIRIAATGDESIARATAMMCRAAENTCFFASVNCASEGSGTTSAIIRPDG
jgi:hypothetical protein